MTVGKRLRYEILRRDNHACRYCGATAPTVALTVDHVTPTALGGTDLPQNLVTACADCNSGKSAAPVDAAVVANIEADAERWAAAMQRAAEIQAAASAELRGWVDAVDMEWTAFDGSPPHRPANWASTVAQLRNAGLALTDILDAASIALNNDAVWWDQRWRYFCGVCWRKVTDRQQIAKGLLAAEDGDRAP